MAFSKLLSRRRGIQGCRRVFFKLQDIMQEILYFYPEFYQGKIKFKLISLCLQANNDFCSTIVIFLRAAFFF
jgi:hypothetical protein